jgi:hypothetical protein
MLESPKVGIVCSYPSRNFKNGQPKRESIDQALRRSSKVVVVISERFVNQEWRKYYENKVRNKDIIPVIIGACAKKAWNFFLGGSDGHAPRINSKNCSHHLSCLQVAFMNIQSFKNGGILQGSIKTGIGLKLLFENWKTKGLNVASTRKTEIRVNLFPLTSNISLASRCALFWCCHRLILRATGQKWKWKLRLAVTLMI